MISWASCTVDVKETILELAKTYRISQMSDTTPKNQNNHRSSSRIRSLVTLFAGVLLYQGGNLPPSHNCVCPDSYFELDAQMGDIKSEKIVNTYSFAKILKFVMQRISLCIYQRTACDLILYMYESKRPCFLKSRGRNFCQKIKA